MHGVFQNDTSVIQTVCIRGKCPDNLYRDGSWNTICTFYHDIKNETVSLGDTAISLPYQFPAQSSMRSLNSGVGVGVLLVSFHPKSIHAKFQFWKGGGDSWLTKNMVFCGILTTFFIFVPFSLALHHR